MTKTFVLAAAMLLTGCATPDFRQSAARTDYTLELPIVKAAQCVARNAREFRPWYGTQIHGVALGLEVTVVSVGAVVAIADIRPAEPGSTLNVFQKRTALTAIGLPSALAKGC